MTHTFLSATAAVALGTASASAVFVAPSTWSVGDANTTAQEWDIFTSPIGNAPDVLDSNDQGQATAFDANAPMNGSFITGSASIYTFSAEVFPAADVPVPTLAGGTTTFIVQTSTFGYVPVAADVTVSDDSDNVYLPVEQVLLTEGDRQGVEQAWYFRFEVPSDVGEYRFLMEAASSSLAFDRLRIDTFTGAAPAAEPLPDAFALPGDANLDGTVDLADFGILRANFGLSAGDFPIPQFRLADFNGDATVDLADFGILRANFGSSAPSDVAALDAWYASVVPEPATASIVSLAGLTLLRRRR
ncbi:MAG: hypothetical protein AAGI46_06265 [Planctomycetota bacterium]